MHESTFPVIERLSYVEMYVSNIFYSKIFFINMLNFRHVSTTKESNCIICVMKQGDIVFKLISPQSYDEQVSVHLARYGDSVKSLGLIVDSVEYAHESAVKHGAISVQPPQDVDTGKTAVVSLFNGVEHVYISKKQVGYTIPTTEEPATSTQKNINLQTIDHIASCHPPHSIEHWADYYKNAFGFSENKNENIYSAESGMNIIIMQSPNSLINFPLVEPSSEKSPLHVYLKHNQGAGIHHIAFKTDNIIQAVNWYESHHGELRKANDNYYKKMAQLHPDLQTVLQHLSPYGIMLEKDDQGVLYQIFTKPIGTRSTFFLEFVQRDKCQGFGTANIKSLYESL